MKFVPRLLLSMLLLACLAMTGCVIPYPSTSQRSPEVRGRVVDAETKQPITNARVALHQHAGTSTVTDSSGCFKLRGTRNRHLLLIGGPCANEWPSGKHYGSDLDVSHPAYASLVVEAREHLSPSSTNSFGRSLSMRDISLTPIAR